MNRAILNFNRENRLEKIKEIKDAMWQTKMEKITEKVAFWFAVLFVSYFGTHLIVHLIRLYMGII